MEHFNKQVQMGTFSQVHLVKIYAKADRGDCELKLSGRLQVIFCQHLYEMNEAKYRKYSKRDKKDLNRVDSSVG